MFIKILLLVVFFAITIAIGLYCRRHATDVSGFVLGGRSVGPWLTAFAYGTSYFSAVVFVGYAGQFGWRFGISATWIGIGNAIIGSLMAWIIFGRRTRIMTQHLGSATMPEFFGSRFDCKNMKVMASASSKLKQSGTQTVTIGDYTVTVVVNSNNKITDVYVGAPSGGGSSQGGNSQGGNSQGGNSQGGNSKGNQQ